MYNILIIMLLQTLKITYIHHHDRSPLIPNISIFPTSSYLNILLTAGKQTLTLQENNQSSTQSTTFQLSPTSLYRNPIINTPTPYKTAINVIQHNRTPNTPSAKRNCLQTSNHKGSYKTGKS